MMFQPPRALAPLSALALLTVLTLLCVRTATTQEDAATGQSTSSAEEPGKPRAIPTPASAPAAEAAATPEKPRRHKRTSQPAATTANNTLNNPPAGFAGVGGASGAAAAVPSGGHVPGKTEAELLRHKAESAQQRSEYDRWKMRLPFWWRKAVIFAELALYICLGVLLGQIIEVAGLVRYLAVIAWPFRKLGALPKEVGAPFIMAFQSGAVANSMLVSARDAGVLDKRQLYTSVLVVSCLSLFAHLPTFVVPLGAAFGVTAAAVFFGVRFAAIVAQLVTILLVSRLLARRQPQTPAAATPCVAFAEDSGATPAAYEAHEAPEAAGLTRWDVANAPCDGGSNPTAEAKDSSAQATDMYEDREAEPPPAPAKHGGNDNQGRAGAFCATVWRRSRRTLARLLLFVVPTFIVMSGLERWGLFDALQNWLDQCNLSWLPPQTPAIVAAQAVSLYNGAIVAGSYVDDGALATPLAVVILLVGSLVTAPIRTLKHALPTYAAVLGIRAGTALAILAQALRVLFLGLATLLLALFWL